MPGCLRKQQQTAAISTSAEPCVRRSPSKQTSPADGSACITGPERVAGRWRSSGRRGGGDGPTPWRLSFQLHTTRCPIRADDATTEAGCRSPSPNGPAASLPSLPRRQLPPTSSKRYRFERSDPSRSGELSLTRSVRSVPWSQVKNQIYIYTY